MHLAFGMRVGRYQEEKKRESAQLLMFRASVSIRMLLSLMNCIVCRVR